MIIVRSLLSACILYFSVGLYSQTFIIAPDSAAIVSVVGTSSLHDWTADASEVTDYPQSIAFDKSPDSTVPEFGFKVKAKSLDGGRGASMNKKIFKALKSDSHPNIEYRQTAPAQISRIDDMNYTILSEGELSIAGSALPVSVELNAVLNDSTLTFKGKKPLKMSDFGIEPPSAMFGQIKTRDDITVHFTFRYIAE